MGITSEDVFARPGKYRLKNMRAQRRAGVRVIRQVFDWAQIERSRGRFNFSYYDRFMRDAARNRLRVLAILFNAPRFHARQAARGDYPPRDNGSFARFARAVAARYGSSGSFWNRRGVRRLPIKSFQVWNEPNLRVYWLPRPDPQAYLRLLRAGHDAIKAVDPTAEVVTAGLPNSLLTSAAPLNEFIRQMYAVPGAKDAFDTFAYNAYARTERDLLLGLREVRRQLNRHGDPAPIWITELGWATQGPKHRFRAGLRGQAVRIRRSFRLIRRLRATYGLRGVVYYSWRDQRPYPPRYQDLWGLHTGLLSRSGRRKPGYFAFRRAARGL